MSDVKAIWTGAELDEIAVLDEIQIAGERQGGSLHSWTPIWVVRVGDALYVRAGFGAKAAWYRHITKGLAHVRANGTDHRVELESHTDPVLLTAVDEAYRRKYRTSSFLSVLISEEARSTTSSLVPRR